MMHTIRMLILLIATTMVLSACQSSNNDRIFQRISPYNYADTLQDLDIAISEYNYRIIHRSHIGQAVRDRGDKQFPLSIIVNFCNITYAKEMLQINPDLINEMPCTIAVRQSGKQVIVSTRLMNEAVDNPKQKAFAKKINANLKGIIEATVE